MHEMSLMSGMLSIANDALRGLNVKRVNAVTVSVGVLSNCLTDALELAFRSLSENTVFEGARLILCEKDFLAKCSVCGKEFTASGFPVACPACTSARLAIISGDEVYIESIDYEEEVCQKS